ncbi:GvpL/GvpF family gas vesicle protein [Streptomyces sp. NPDC015130]|uniref:GvpL/GvpF family gas vesicle protein n=1 Tax=Streptomyces sp. NPDC015130 TaxID=3364940 RepID=UPI0036FE9A48
MNGEPSLTYVYAVADPTPELGEPPADLRGVDDAPVALLLPDRAGPAGPAFVVSRVSAGHWGAEVLRSRFEDLDWLDGTARAHHHVIQALMDRTTVLPLRLATLYQDDDRAREALRDQREVFAARLALLAHHTEYGVKVYVAADDTPRSRADDPAHHGGAPAAQSPGKAYLQARRAQHHAREERYLRARRAVERIAATAAQHATHVVRHPAQSGPLSPRENGENVLNDAYLVPDDRVEAFRSALRQVGQDLTGVRVEVTGPWAPYSFAMPASPPTDTAAPPGP